MIVKSGENILTILAAPDEDDAFQTVIKPETCRSWWIKKPNPKEDNNGRSNGTNAKVQMS